MAEQNNKVMDPKDVQNPGLVWALELYFENQTPEKHAKVAELVKDAKFIVPVIFRKLEPATEGGEPRTEVSLRILSTKDGKTALPVFTDMDQYTKREKAENEQITVLAMPQLTELLKKGKVRDLVINPYDTRALTMHLNVNENAPAASADGKQKGPATVRADQVTTSPMTELPQDVCEKLSALLVKVVGVRRAWLTNVENEGQAGILCIVDFENMNQQPLFQAMAQAAGPLINGKRFFAAPYDAFGKKSVGDALPFYTKEGAAETMVM